MAMNHRDVGSLEAEGAIAPPDFGRSVYPILVRGAHYTHHITDLPTHQFSDPLTVMNPSFWAFLTDKEKDFCSRSIPKSLHSYIHRRLTRHNNCAALYTRDWEESEKKLGSFVIVRIPEKPQQTIHPNLTARLENVQDFHFMLGLN